MRSRGDTAGPVARRPTPGTGAARGAAALALAALLLAAGAPAARAIPAPELFFELGRTFGVDSKVDGDFDQGGFATALSALWTVEDLVRFGVSAFADEMGSRTTELLDETQNPPVSLGTFETGHVNAIGASWRMEVLLPRLGPASTFARGDWGVYRFRQDQNGAFVEGATKLGWSLGGGLMLPLRGNQALGATLCFDRVFSTTRDYMTAALAWHWRPGSSPQGSPKR